jgi:hypothetical protein
MKASDPRYEWVEVWSGTFLLKEAEWYTTMKRRVEKHKEALKRKRI